MPCAPMPREAWPSWTVFGIRTYHVDEVLGEDLLAEEATQTAGDSPELNLVRSLEFWVLFKQR